jgi:hypothetical protein
MISPPVCRQASLIRILFKIDYNALDLSLGYFLETVLTGLISALQEV